MTYVVDSHTLIWFLERDPKLPASVVTALFSAHSQIVIPSIVLAEIWHLFQRNRIRTSLQDVKSKILTSANVSVYPLDETVLDTLPAEFEIHDAIIVATALVHRDVFRQPTQLITRDRMITDSKLIDVTW